ncbi:MFS transporter [alpha proteobacterium AAP81b]|nr:MFS transporter [alpha proteobacterium AAP81b]
MSRALAFIFVTVLIDAIGFGIVIPVMPQLIVELSGKNLAGAAEISGWIMFLYASVQFLCGPVIGGLSDRFGRRPVLLASLVAFGCDYLVLAFAPTLGWLVMARIVAGITGATFPTAYAYIADISKPEERGGNFGIIGMAFGLGFIIGPALGAVFAQFGHRVPFMLAAGLAFANALYGLFVLPESLPPERRRAFDWRRANPLGTLMQLRSQHPRVLLMVATVFVWTLGYQSLYAAWNYSVIARFGWSPTQVGWSLVAVGVVGALVQGFLARRLIPRWGARTVIVAGGVSAIMAYLIYAFATQGWLMYLGIAVAALQGLVFPAIQGMMSSEVAPDAQGELQGALSSAQSLSSIIGPPLMTGAFAWGQGPGGMPGAPFVLAALFSAAALAIFARGVAMGVGRRAVAAPA